MASERDLLLIFVSYHTSGHEIEVLKSCLDDLSENIGFAVVINDYKSGEPVDLLSDSADYFLPLNGNNGYGRAVNKLISRIDKLPKYICILNTDVSWLVDPFSLMVNWFNINTDVVLAVPAIHDSHGNTQKLCKRNPTLLGLFSRRFVPDRFKPQWLFDYDNWYVMSSQDYSQVFECTYLSGCCMFVRSSAFKKVGGFDERYFLYLEDADLTRVLSLVGKCIHFPLTSIMHQWGRGNYISWSLMLVNLSSLWKYFSKWGWTLW